VFGLVHGDLHFFNVLFGGGEARAIDFDDAGWGHYVGDLAAPLEALEGRPDYPALRAALLAGYRSVRPLPAAQEAHLPAFLAVRRLVLLGWLLDNRAHPGFRAWAPAEAARLLHRPQVSA
jgi:Ser/Thr protein kinase RdoA (MazF antagonist)